MKITTKFKQLEKHRNQVDLLVKAISDDLSEYLGSEYFIDCSADGLIIVNYDTQRQYKCNVYILRKIYSLPPEDAIKYIETE